MNRSELRDQAMEADGFRCRWPECPTVEGTLEMAHIRGIGMGGRPSADTLDNVTILCRYHHGLLDGRDHAGLRRELGLLLGAYVRMMRPAPG